MSRLVGVAGYNSQSFGRFMIYEKIDLKDLVYSKNLLETLKEANVKVCNVEEGKIMNCCSDCGTDVTGTYTPALYCFESDIQFHSNQGIFNAPILIFSFMQTKLTLASTSFVTKQLQCEKT